MNLQSINRKVGYFSPGKGGISLSKENWTAPGPGEGAEWLRRTEFPAVKENSAVLRSYDACKYHRTHKQINGV